jgi:hypothetical protein
MCAASSSASLGPGDQYQKAIDAYRSIARWVVSSFGAVAAALVVGVQISSIGRLHDWRLAGAFLSVALVFGSILVIIKAAVRVLLPVRVSYHGFARAPEFALLREELERDQAPLNGEAETAAQLAEKYDDFLKYKDETHEVHEDAQKRHTATPSVASQKEIADSRKAWEDAEEKADTLYEHVLTITWLGRLLQTQKIFSAAMRLIYRAIVVAAVGAAAFAYLSSPPAKATPATNIRLSINEPEAKAPPPPATNVHVSVNEPKTCVDLYLALDKLAHAKPNIGSHWPTTSLGAQDHACGFHSEKELAHFLSFLAQP